MLFNLRSDPFERAQHESGDYVRWFVEHAFVIVPAQGIVGQHLASFRAISTTSTTRFFLGRAGAGNAEAAALQQLEELARHREPRKVCATLLKVHRPRVRCSAT